VRRPTEDVLERREFKYLVPRQLVPQLRRALAGVCVPDRHAGPDGTYKVRSLYLDTPRYDLFYANAREAPVRFKARVRCYPSRSSTVFLEIKKRVLDTIVKTRAPVPDESWKGVVEGMILSSDESAESRDSRARAQFLTLVHTYHLRPVLLVEYLREAYTSTIDPYARATFDTRVTCQARYAFDLEADPRRWRSVSHPGRTITEPAYVVLELKFGKTAPAWMVAMVQRFDLLRHSFSKYGYSLRAEMALPSLRVGASG
jgi:hypothetical protein